MFDFGDRGDDGRLLAISPYGAAANAGADAAFTAADILAAWG